MQQCVVDTPALPRTLRADPVPHVPSSSALLRVEPPDRALRDRGLYHPGHRGAGGAVRGRSCRGRMPRGRALRREYGGMLCAYAYVLVCMLCAYAYVVPLG
eukprot:3940737-Rhodomonas_salina.2